MDDDHHDIIAHDAAWLREHASQVLALIQRSPSQVQALIRLVWAHGFHAGERHESITVNLKYLPAVIAQDGIRAGAQKGGKARRKITADAYEAACARGPKSRKQLAAWLNVTPQALRNFEKASGLSCKVA